MLQAQEALTHFPRALSDYPDPAGASILQILQSRVEIEPFNAIATAIFLLAILHTFAAARFEAAGASDSTPPMTLARGPAARRRGRACSRGSCTSSAKWRWCSVSGLWSWPWRSPRTKAEGGCQALSERHGELHRAAVRGRDHGHGLDAANHRVRRDRVAEGWLTREAQRPPPGG